MIKFQETSAAFHMINFGFCLTLLLTITASSTVFASQKSSEVEKCVSVENDIARLLCYDTLFGRVSANQAKVVEKTTVMPQEATSQTLLLPKADKVIPPPKKPVETVSVAEDFGAEQLKKEEVEEGPSEIQATISTIVENSRGLRTFTLANGQKWREKESSRLKVKEGQEVTIKKGTFSAYFMKKEGSNRTIRVRRIN